MIKTRRQLIGAILSVALTTGCTARNDDNEATAAETTTSSLTRIPSSTQDASKTPTPRETITNVTRIRLHSVTLTETQRKQITPLSFESLPADERRIVTAAADGGFSVSYGRSEYPTDGGRTAGLSSLMSRVVDRLNRQTEAYKTNHTAVANAPPHVDAVYVRYEGELSCLDIVDGDQKYYHCPGE